MAEMILLASVAPVRGLGMVSIRAHLGEGTTQVGGLGWVEAAGQHEGQFGLRDRGQSGQLLTLHRVERVGAGRG